MRERGIGPRSEVIFNRLPMILLVANPFAVAADG
jgi:hypothetical protein